ncbi:MAG: hypothetical protein Q8Q09_22925 [Deltaproteobacteria bacterium]|nr:hypothetical protein [Deltaproteobacteria bacterium]
MNRQLLLLTLATATAGALAACGEPPVPGPVDAGRDTSLPPMDTMPPPPDVVTPPSPDVVMPSPDVMVADTGPAGCRRDEDCDDMNACTSNVCDTMTGVCGFRSIEGCCLSTAQCNDGNTCTTDTCDIGTNRCANTLRAGCCTADAECNDSIACTRDSCDLATNRCSNTVDPMCCTDGQTRPCYSGAAGTRTVGACRDGIETCSGNRWSGSCAGEVLPAASESCDAANVDENCNGMRNEGCSCTNGTSRACYTGPAGTQNRGLCRDGMQSCSAGTWGTCTGQTLPATEICGNMRDEDCNGSDLVCPLPPPANDRREAATVITVTHRESVVMGTTVGATHDGPATPGCGCSSGANVWYQFTLTSDSAVYLDTSSTRAADTLDTSLFLTNAAGTLVPPQASNGQSAAGLCNDDSGCGGVTAWGSALQSRTWGFLTAGTYFVAVGGCGTGGFTLRLQHIPTTEGSFFYRSRLSGDAATQTVLIGTNRHSSHCGGTISGEDVRWFTTCGATPQFFSMCEGDGGGYLSRATSTETTRWDPVLYIHSGITGIESTCSSTGGAGIDCRGRIGTNLTSTTFDTVQGGARFAMASASRGLNGVLVDERARGSGMYYNLRYRVTDR